MYESICFVSINDDYDSEYKVTLADYKQFSTHSAVNVSECVAMRCAALFPLFVHSHLHACPDATVYCDSFKRSKSPMRLKRMITKESWIVQNIMIETKATRFLSINAFLVIFLNI